jgi:hypothetical protein
MRYFKVLLFQTLLLTLVLFAANSASADQINFTLNNSGVAGGPFVNVNVNLTSTGVATITFTSAGGAAIIDGGSLDLNVNGSFTVASTTGFSAFNGNWCSGTGNSLVGNACLNAGGGNIDGFGSFNVVLDQFAGSGNSSNQITVTLTGGTWTSASQVLFSNAGGSMAGSHVTLNSCTFYVANGTTGSPASCGAVPEPSIYLGLLGSGLIALPFIRRMRSV